MEIKDKKKLLKLLNTYQNDLITKEEGGTIGLKGLYDHARIIAKRLSKEVSDSFSTISY